jgi:hypothetical protein
LALDWDLNHLHVVEGEVSGSAVRLLRAFTWEQPFPTDAAAAAPLGPDFRKKLKEAGMGFAPVLFSVGRDRVNVKEVRFPPVPVAEEAALVRFQALKELTESPEDVVLDYTMPGNPGDGERRAQVLLVRKEVFAVCQAFAQAAGLKLAGVSPRSFGVMACLKRVFGTSALTPPPEPADAAAAGVVLGERWAEFCVFQGNRLLLSRSLSMGPNLAADIRRSLSVHAGQSPANAVKAVYMTGPSIQEVRPALVELIEIPVHAFDPFALNEKIEVHPLTRGSYAGAVGQLYDWGAQSGKLPINFANPRQPPPPDRPGFRYARLGLIAGAVLLIGLGVIGRTVLAGWEADEKSVEADSQEVSQQLAEAQLTSKRLKAIDDWDRIKWFDEIYNIEALIPDVNTLRVTSLNAEPITSAEKVQSKFIGFVTLKGKLLGNDEPRRPLDDLVAELNKSPFYSPEPPVVLKDGFTLRIKVGRRGPTDYVELLTVPGPPDDPAKEEDKEGKEGKGRVSGKEKRKR